MHATVNVGGQPVVLGNFLALTLTTLVRCGCSHRE